MKVTGSFKILRALGLLCGMSITAVSCSSSQQQQAGEENLEATEQGNTEAANQESANAAEGEEGGNEYANQASEEGGNEYANADSGGNEYAADSGDAGADATATSDTELVENASAGTDSYANAAAPADNSAAFTNPAPMNNATAPAAETANAAVAATPAAPAPQGDSGRVVRFVSANDTVVYGSSDGSGAAVGTLSQGDPIVVSISGDWAKIGEGRFVQVASLSEQAVPRARTSNPWH